MPQCTYGCTSKRVVVDRSTGTVIGCLECDWADVGAPGRCIAPTVNQVYRTPDGRCSRLAGVGGYCRQHARSRPQIWDEMCRSFRVNPCRSGLPDAYLQVFTRALRDAGMAAENERDVQDALHRAKRARGTSVVYFVEREGLIKIGTTTNLKARLKAISKGGNMPPGMTVGPVLLLASTPGDRSDEARFHRRFDKQRIPKTEWFRPCKALRHLIEDLNRARERGIPDVLDAALNRTA